MKTSSSLLASAVFVVGSGIAAAQPAGLRNAKVTVRAVAPGALAGEVDRIASGTKGPVWVGYDQPVIDGGHRMCCFDSWSGHGKRRGRGGDRDDFCCGGCSLENERSFTYGDDGDRTVSLDPNRGLVVLLRAIEGRVGKIRALDEQCGIDAAGLPFVWLTGIRPEESVDMLAAMARRLERAGHGEDAAGSALAAIAFTRHPAADTALDGMVAPGNSRELRQQAAFWLGNARGARGYDVLARLAGSEPDEDLRKHLTFAISQSHDPRAIPKLIAMAKGDRTSEVRGQALFWLAQEASDRVAKAIHNAIEDDPDEEVKKSAVFALSQMKTGDSVAELIRVARTNRNAEVRRQAIFWLGQSRDARALDFIEEILVR